MVQEKLERERLKRIELFGESVSDDDNVGNARITNTRFETRHQNDAEERFDNEKTNDVNEDEIVSNVLKRNSSIICLDYKRLRFLDVINYCGQKISLDKYLRTYKIGAIKQVFPYEFFDSLEKLNDTKLPSKDEFYSRLKQTHITDEDYNLCQERWENKKMKSMRDFLIDYNVSDVKPFLEAVNKQFAFYEETFKIDLFKDAYSLPGVSMLVMFKFIPKTLNMPQIYSNDKDLYKEWKHSLFGGLSIILHRRHIKDETFIRNNSAKPCKKILGLDATNCYGFAFEKDFPTGLYCRYFASEGFKRRKVLPFGFLATEWMCYLMKKENIFIQHKFNGGEVKFDGVFVDGFCAEKRRIFEFLGCLHHGCKKCRHKRKDSNKKPLTRSPISKKSLDELFEETENRLKWLRNKGYDVTAIWECEWVQEKRDNAESLQKYAIEEFFYKANHPLSLNNKESVIKKILKEEIFGVCRVTITTPDYLKEYFAEFPPIFKSATITLDDVGSYMKEAALRSGQSIGMKRKSLILSYYGVNIWLITPLIKWYVKKGLRVDIHEVVTFTPKKCFKDYINLVTEKRRLGDVDENSALIAEQMKLLANSSYGKFITNNEKHSDTVFANEYGARLKINSPNFRRLEEMDDDVYQVESLSASVKIDLPLVIGLFVLQHAKLLIMSFIYDFIKVYFPTEDVQLLSHDTDSVYIAISSNDLEELIFPHLREKYFKTVRDKYFPAECCKAHKNEYLKTRIEGGVWFRAPCCEKKHIRENRTPGLFKPEFTGTSWVALSPKCYFAYSEDKSKYSSKGVSKTNNLTLDSYDSIIKREVDKKMCVNRGFIYKNGDIRSYRQFKTGLTYLYFKRIVHEDGVTTSPLRL